MLITVTTLEDAVYTVEVSAEMELQDFCAVLESETKIPASSMIVLHNGRPLVDKRKTMGAYGLVDGDMILVQRLSGVSPGAAARQSAAAPPSSASSSGAPMIDFSSVKLGQAPPASASSGQGNMMENPEMVRQLLLSSPHDLSLMRERNPPLASVVNDSAAFQRVLSEQRAEARQREEERQRLLRGDPFDPEIQRRIAEEIQQHNIDNAMEQAIEYMPESFAQVIMLYINCKVNGHPVKAFVDSGAQMTIMSQNCAKRCNIERLIDRRWAGIAKGVGEQKILGRVHMGQIQIENDFLANSFSILEDQPMDLLLGLDMLKRHQCCIDLRKGILTIGTTGTETRFLSEADLPESARLVGETSSQSSGDLSASVKPEEEEKLSLLTQHGFPRNIALDELRNCAGDVDAALAALLQRAQSH